MRKAKERNRIAYGIAVFIVILLGLGSRHYADTLPGFIAEYAGDTLWAAMIFFGIGFLFKSWSTLKVGIVALLFSFFIETSQLYHSPWIDAIRSTRIGALVLGFGFLWSDLVCYCIGIIIGILVDKLIISRV